MDLVLESNKDFEDYQRDNLFYLTKEILCDFILYCDDRDCCEKKYYLIKEINAKDSLKKNKYFSSYPSKKFFNFKVKVWLCPP